MTFISWSLEFIAGLIIFLFWFIKNPVVVKWLALLDIVINFILIPISYVLNNDINKAVIVAQGWVQGFRRLINRESRVAPKQNNGVENPGNANPVPVPIPTSSRNISELANRGQRHRNNLRQATSVGFTAQQLNTVEDTRENTPPLLNTFRTRDIDRYESNQNLPEEAVNSSTNDRVDLEDEADGIETIHLNDIRESSRQNCPINSSRALHENAWM